MTDLTNRDYLASALTTEAQFQTGIGALYDFVAQLLGGSGPVAHTPTADVVTATSTFLQIDTESSASTDNLKNILNTNIGAKVIAICSTSSSRVITVKHLASGTGQFDLTGDADAVLDTPEKMMTFYYDADNAKWVEMGRNFGVFLPSTADVNALKTRLGLGTAAYATLGVSTGQVPTADSLGAAAFKAVGTSAGQVPLNSNLGALAYKSTVETADLAGTGVTPGTYTNNTFTVGPDGRIVSATSGTPGAVTVGQADIRTSTGSGQTAYNSSGLSDRDKTVLWVSRYSGSSTLTGIAMNIFACYQSANVDHDLRDAIVSTQIVTLPGGGYGFEAATSINSNGAGLWRANFTQRYVVASPPFDVGDGEMGGFIYLLLNNAGEIDGYYAADVPTWAYNGPTNITPDYIDEDGNKYKMVRDRLTIEDRKAGKSALVTLVEIDQEMKNRDMNIIPHPFIDFNPNTHRVVLLDPMNQTIRDLVNEQNFFQSDEGIRELVDGNYFKLTNHLASRKGPDDLIQVGFTL